MIAGLLLLAFSGILFLKGENKNNNLEAENTTLQVQEDEPIEESKKSRTFTETTLEAITEDPEKFIRAELVVSGVVRDVDSRRLLSLEDEKGNTVYVITLRTLTDDELAKTEKSLIDGAPAKVEGALFRMSLSDIEERLGFAVSDETSTIFTEPQLTLIARTLEIRTE